ncbi:OLC1v1027997C1 [Oldenlandia corymbosa var. corymbosa]|uniref:OLC1v1027997C1 n=1 Tax=Oldenlandia corymbosa var. corymbosa TaxID=529605 RepID=A0AAV1CCR5_OLDCO|nr:OLC1v1027997C1 [Oldenlandia corymbosa var. corymbosa]
MSDALPARFHMAAFPFRRSPTHHPCFTPLPPSRHFSSSTKLRWRIPEQQWQKASGLLVESKRKGAISWVVRSVLNDNMPSINGKGETEPTRILLERLFSQTQKLEEQIGKDPDIPEVAEIRLSLEKLEADFLAAFSALKKKEYDLQEAERKVRLEYEELNLAKEEMAQLEKEIACANSRREELEEELMKANLGLASQVLVIDDLKQCLTERDKAIVAAKRALSLKGDEIERMSQDLSKKSEEAASAELELRSKVKLLDAANEIVRRQEDEIHELQRMIQEKEEGIEVSKIRQKAELDKLRIAESNLKKRTADWLTARQELKKLEEEMSKHTGEANDTLKDFERVKALLAEVRSKLVLSQKSFALSRQKVEEQEQLLEKQLEELKEQMESVQSYTITLEDAKMEIENERVKMRVIEARNKELERELLMEKEVIAELQKDLNKQRESLERAFQEISSLNQVLVLKNAEFEEMENRLQVKDAELVDARLEIQHLISERASFQGLLEKKDTEVSNAEEVLAAVNREIIELNILMKHREDQLIEATTALQEKEINVQALKHEVDDNKHKFSEAESVVEKIVELTQHLALSAGDFEGFHGTSLLEEANNCEPAGDNLSWQRTRLETELQLTKETLRMKEMEVLASQRALTIKEEKLKLVSRKLDNKEMEWIKMKEEMIRESAELRQLYALAQERIGEKSIGDLAIEKLELEAAQLEVEAATNALQKLAQMSKDLLNMVTLSTNSDVDISILLPQSGLKNPLHLDESHGVTEFRTEVAKLLALTEQLVIEAGTKQVER